MDDGDSSTTPSLPTTAARAAAAAAVLQAARSALDGSFETSFADGEKVELYGVYRVVEEVREPLTEIGVQSAAAAPFVEQGVEIGDELLFAVRWERSGSGGSDQDALETSVRFGRDAVMAYFRELTSSLRTAEGDVAFWIGSTAAQQSFCHGLVEVVEELLCHADERVSKGALKGLGTLFFSFGGTNAIAIETMLKAIWARHPRLETSQRVAPFTFGESEVMLHRCEGDRVTQFHGAVTNGVEIFERWGDVGHREGFETHPFETTLSWSQNLERVLAGARSQGFDVLAPDQHHLLVVRLCSARAPIARDVADFLEGKGAVVFEDLAYATGVGAVAGVRATETTLTVQLRVVDLEVTKRLVKELLGAPPIAMADGAVVFDGCEFSETLPEPQPA